MNTELKRHKQTLRAFMRANYTDERLAMLLAHARDGRLDFTSCCCFIGIVTAQHAFVGYGCGSDSREEYTHTKKARMLPGGRDAENAYHDLCGEHEGGQQIERDGIRMRRLIPIIKAEMKRRSRMLKSERLDEFYGDADESERCVEIL